jgi:hypothetical protein
MSVPASWLPRGARRLWRLACYSRRRSWSSEDAHVEFEVFDRLKVACNGCVGCMDVWPVLWRCMGEVDELLKPATWVNVFEFWLLAWTVFVVVLVPASCHAGLCICCPLPLV